MTITTSPEERRRRFTFFQESTADEPHCWMHLQERWCVCACVRIHVCGDSSQLTACWPRGPISIVADGTVFAGFNHSVSIFTLIVQHWVKFKNFLVILIDDDGVRDLRGWATRVRIPCEKGHVCPQQELITIHFGSCDSSLNTQNTRLSQDWSFWYISQWQKHCKNIC